jgi:hypothetical protein
VAEPAQRLPSGDATRTNPHALVEIGEALAAIGQPRRDALASTVSRYVNDTADAAMAITTKSLALKAHFDEV